MYDTQVADQKTNNYTFYRLHVVLKHYLNLSMPYSTHKRAHESCHNEAKFT